MIKKIEPQPPVLWFINLCKELDTLQHKEKHLSLNFSVRGQYITVYMHYQQLPFAINELHAKGYAENGLSKYWFVEQGYPKNDFYFNMGPYHFRLAPIKEKQGNQQDIQWLQENHNKELSKLKEDIRLLEAIVLAYKNA